MPTLDKVEQAINKSVDVSVNIFNLNIDVISSLACFIAACCCIYLSAVILKERTIWVHVQRWTLGALAVALFANAATFYPEWATIQGHRPTGAIVDIMVMVVLVVMAIRGYMIYQPGRHTNDNGERIRG